MTDAPTRAKGPLPQYFDDPAIDQLHSALLALAAELSVAYDRIDTLERMLERKGALSRTDIDRFEPDEAALQERAARREALVARLLRPFRDYRDHVIERAKQ